MKQIKHDIRNLYHSNRIKKLAIINFHNTFTLNCRSKKDRQGFRYPAYFAEIKLSRTPFNTFLNIKMELRPRKLVYQESDFFTTSIISASEHMLNLKDKVLGD